MAWSVHQAERFALHHHEGGALQELTFRTHMDSGEGLRAGRVAVKKLRLVPRLWDEVSLMHWRVRVRHPRSSAPKPAALTSKAQASKTGSMQESSPNDSAHRDHAAKPTLR